MENIVAFLDENNKKKDKEKEININSRCIDEAFKKAEIDGVIKKISNEYEKQDIYYGWGYKDIIKYKYDKYDPNFYSDFPIKYKNSEILGNKLLKKRQNETDNNVVIKRELVTIDANITSIDDLIKLIEENPLDHSKEYNINMSSLHKIYRYLIRLNEMIGMKDLKENILDQILYFIQNLHKNADNSVPGDFMHTVIYGPPGTGKTEVAKIIGKIFSKLEILSKGTFKKVTRTDLVAGYLGQTATKTNDVINECLGGVLFIDEAYSLGNAEKRDIFSKECIDTLCEALSNHKDKLMVIIAGYESELKTCFFAYNQGLESRFNWRFKTGEYKGKELYDIFIKKVANIGWEIDPDIQVKWFEKNLVYFKYFGRDIETVLSKAKIAHSRRVFCKSDEYKKKLCLKDLEKGFENFLKIDEVKNRKDEADSSKRLDMLYI